MRLILTVTSVYNTGETGDIRKFHKYLRIENLKENASSSVGEKQHWSGQMQKQSRKKYYYSNTNFYEDHTTLFGISNPLVSEASREAADLNEKKSACPGIWFQ